MKQKGRHCSQNLYPRTIATNIRKQKFIINNTTKKKPDHDEHALNANQLHIDHQKKHKNNNNINAIQSYIGK